VRSRGHRHPPALAPLAPRGRDDAQQPGPLDSSPARWTILYEDSEVLLLRGRFPVASRVGLANTFDVVAMVPNDDVCGPVARSGAASLVFRPSGNRVLQLGSCSVLGVAAPPSG
jgi:hypothetical protein